MTHTARVIMKAGRAAVAITLLAPGCSSLLTKQTPSSYVILDSLLASTGREPDKLSSHLASDVLTYVKNGDVSVPTIFEDGLQATFELAMKDPGSQESPAAPSTTNFITLTRYHVQFVRSDGRNTEGVDVPYAFDGALTTTVGLAGATVSGTLVRVQSKSEAPLKALVGLPGAISTIAQVTFYGKDQTGRDVSVSGSLSVTFSDWGDPQ